MLKKISLNLLFAFAAGLFFVSAANAQQTAPDAKPTPPAQPTTEDDGEVLRVTSTLITVPVSVTDANGQPVQGLTVADFRLDEEGQRQQLEQVSTADQVPLEIALLVDVSGSVNPLFEFEKKAAAQFLETIMKPEDRASIFLVGEQPTMIQERGTSQTSASVVRAINPSGKFTAFYDAVTAATNYLKKNAPSRSRRVILALTDGEDNWSSLTREAEKATYRDLDINKLDQKKRNELASKTDASHKRAQEKILRDLQNADTVFYAINPAGTSVRLNKISTRAHSAMQRFADDTGGAAFLPNNAQMLDQIFQQISAELRAQYLLQYYAEAEHPAGKYVRLKVDLSNPRNLRVRARQGYFAKTQ